MEDLHKSFREFFECLNSHEVRYLMIGGYAVAYHGFPRSTGDLDVWVDATPDNAARIAAAAEQFATAGWITVERAMRPGLIFEMGHEPLKLQVFTSIPGVAFDECYRSHRIFRDGPVRIPVIDLPHLIRAKEASSQNPSRRNRDLRDLDELKAIQDRQRSDGAGF